MRKEQSSSSYRKRLMTRRYGMRPISRYCEKPNVNMKRSSRKNAVVFPFEQPTMTEDRLHLPAPRHPEWAKASMASDATFLAVEPLRPNATRTEPAAICPQDPRGFPLSEPEKESHAQGMTDEELARHVESNLRPVGESLRNNIAYIREARERFAHPGRRVPV